ncbi:MAG TPA: DUF4055 domain-containing protein [Thiobacillus sp.]
MALAVNEQSEQVAALAKQWPLLEALQEGTPAMRKGRTMFLPKWPNEEAQSYDARVATATLFPAYRRTVSVMSGKPFAEPVTLNDDVPAQLVSLAEDVDRMGVNLHAFASEMFDEAMGYGFCGILVDYPDTMVRDDQGRPLPNQPRRTVAEIEREGIRPYWVRVKHNQILGWRTETRNGRQQLSQLRLLESVEEEDGDFGTKQVQQVRVLYPGSWQLWRQTGDKGEWEIYREGRTSLTEIPFAPIYGRREGFMIGKPPMLDLAYLNVKHWQSQSDQDTIEHVARVPILAVIGVDAKDVQLTVGANSAVALPDNGDMKYVEHSGNSIKAGADSLIRLEEQMIQSGAELLVKKPGDRSATESANDAEGNKSDLQRMAEMFMDSLDLALYFTAKFMGLPSGGTVKLFTDFGAGTLSEASSQLVLNIQQGGLITKGTAIKELQRRGVLDEAVDAETELALVEAEGPAPGTMTDEEPE